MEEFADKVVVITGGNSGIGLSIAQHFDRQGAKLAILGRDQKKLAEATSSLKNALPFQGDVCKIADLDRCYKEIHKKFGRIDILVANAGIAGLCHLSEVDEKFFDSIVDTNYKGLFFSVQRALPFFNNPASIILISSLAAHVGWPSHSVYSSAKAAVSHLTRGFSTDLVNQGIRVNAISPGFIDTPIFDAAKAVDPQVVEKLSQNIPAKRFAQPDEIARAVLFLASPQSSYIMGADLIIDGGMTAIYPAKH